jgi:predicted dehydrogenase
MTIGENTTEAPRALRVAVVGMGERGAIGQWVNQSSTGARVVAVVDPASNRGDRAVELYGTDVRLLTSHRELTRGIVDAALVTSPDDTHAEIAIDLLRAGIPIYLEKPIATSLEEADRILDVAHETGTRLYVGHNMRHTAMARLMKEIIDRGEIGEVKSVWCRHFVGKGGDFYFKDWHADRSRSTGLLLQKAAHDIDFIHWLTSSHSVEVVGMGDLMVYGGITDRRDRSGERMWDWYSNDNWPPLSQTGLNPVVDVEDVSMMLMRLESGVLASYQQCHFTPDYWRNFTVIGTEGRLENFGDKGGGVIRVWNRRVDFNPDGDASYPIIDDEDGHDTADRLCVDEFLKFVLDGTRPVTSALGGRHAVAAGIAATESLRNRSQPMIVGAPASSVTEYFEANQGLGD